MQLQIPFVCAHLCMFAKMFQKMILVLGLAEDIWETEGQVQFLYWQALGEEYIQRPCTFCLNV